MTLTEAAFWTKRLGIIVVIFVVVVFVVFYFIFKKYEGDLPQQYLQGDFACTETRDEFLPHQLSIPSLELLPDSEMNFNIETVSGKYDDLPSVVNMYRYTNLGQILNSQGEAKALAKKMGFNADEVVRRGTTEYTWFDNDTQKSLTINARDLNFTLKTSVGRIRSMRQNSDLPSELEAIEIATASIRSLGILDKEYTEVQPSVFFIEMNPDGTYSQADSLVNAELIRVDFHRKIPMISIPSNLVGADSMVKTLVKKNMSYEMGIELINNERVDTFNFSTLITYQNPVKSNISVYVGPEDKSSRILADIYQIEYKKWSIEPMPCGTYELVPPSNAVQRIQNGEGSLVYLNYGLDEVQAYEPQTVKRFNIYDIYITYYEGPFEQNYLQPVYMITGEAELKNGDLADFHMYYPAISYDTVTNRKILEAPVIEETTGFL